MLHIFRSAKEIVFRQLCNLYEEELIHNGEQSYPYLDKYQQINESEQDFYQFVREFLKMPDTFYAIWILDGHYVSALRIESYQDGVILTGLQTASHCRRKGYAEALISGTISYLRDRGVKRVYSHIRNGNIPSVQVHLKCGFQKNCDYASYIDGSVDYRSATFLKTI